MRVNNVLAMHLPVRLLIVKHFFVKHFFVKQVLYLEGFNCKAFIHQVLYCIVLYSSIYIAPLNSHRQTEALKVCTFIHSY